MTLIALIWHESFHILAMMQEGISGRMKPRLRGLSLYPQKTLSYRSERRIAAAGPLGGFIGAGLCLCLAPLARAYFFEFALCHIFTSLSNLLPIEGYDGYRILSSSAAIRGHDGLGRFLPRLSFALSGGLTIISLSVFGILGEGLWHAGAFLFALIFSIPGEKMGIFANSREKRRIREI
jgi:Zn-dependent protease